jgi:hypothetical protein
VPLNITHHQCKDLNGRVRGFFAEGHKSYNKNYFQAPSDLEELTYSSLTQQQIARAERRLENYKLSYEHRVLRDKRSNAEWAEALLKMPTDHRSGNCHQMAVVAAYWALNSYHVDRNHIFIAQLRGKGDHAFCLLSTRASSLQCASLRAFIQCPAARVSKLIDPWLNVVCRADQYEIYGWKQLGSWGRQGKRVSWLHGAQGEGWYHPNGEYRDEFFKAPVQLEPFIRDSK